jgi:hypothetical protein
MSKISPSDVFENIGGFDSVSVSTEQASTSKSISAYLKNYKD